MNFLKFIFLSTFSTLVFSQSISDFKEPVFRIQELPVICSNSALGGAGDCKQILEAVGYYIPVNNGSSVTVTCYVKWFYRLNKNKKEVLIEFEPEKVKAIVQGRSFRTQLSFKKSIHSIHHASVPVSHWQCEYGSSR